MVLPALLLLAADVHLAPCSLAGVSPPVVCGTYPVWEHRKAKRGRKNFRLREQSAACAIWPKGAVLTSHRELVRSKTPVLLLSGEHDPVHATVWCAGSSSRTAARTGRCLAERRAFHGTAERLYQVDDGPATGRYGTGTRRRPLHIDKVVAANRCRVLADLD